MYAVISMPPSPRVSARQQTPETPHKVLGFRRKAHETLTLHYFWFLLHSWLSELKKVEEDGSRICPLLLKELGRYAPNYCVCDIPLTQSGQDLFSPSFRRCHSGGHCLPREKVPELVYEELNPRRTQYQSVHLFDEEELSETRQRQLNLPLY